MINSELARLKKMGTELETKSENVTLSVNELEELKLNMIENTKNIEHYNKILQIIEINPGCDDVILNAKKEIMSIGNSFISSNAAFQNTLNENLTLAVEHIDASMKKLKEKEMFSHPAVRALYNAMSKFSGLKYFKNWVLKDKEASEKIENLTAAKDSFFKPPKPVENEEKGQELRRGPEFK